MPRRIEKRNYRAAWRLIAVAAALCGLTSACRRPSSQPPNAAMAPAPEPSAEISPTPNAAKNTLRVTFLDVGQGDSAIIETPAGKTLLIDAGLPDSEKIILGYCQKRGITRLDYVIASHPHNDHIGGMAGVLGAIPFGAVYDSALPTGSPVQENFLRAIRAGGGRLTPARAGQKVPIEDGVTMEILAPEDASASGSGDDSWINNHSVVARFLFGKTRLLFTGDMEEEERRKLLATGADLRGDVLKIAHHGSRNGTDAAFLRRARPRIAILSCGADNPYGHPHKEVMTALQAARVTLFRTDQHGTITLVCDNQGHLTPLPERASSSASPPPVRPSVTSSSVPSLPPLRFIGDIRGKVYFPLESPTRPAPHNRVYFRTQQEAESAGYRRVPAP